MVVATTQLFGDESGASGENLFDMQTPVFVYSLVKANDQEAADLVAGLRESAKIQGPELKLAMFKRNKRPELLASWLSQNVDRISLYAIDKRYMAVAKVIDNVVEEVWHRRGENFYAIEGLARWMAATLYVAGPEAMPRRDFDAMVDKFVTVTRARQLTNSAAEEFIQCFESARRACRGGPVGDVLDQVLEARADIHSVLDASKGCSTLDPLTPSISALARQWGVRSSGPLELTLDQNPLLDENWIDTTFRELTSPSNVLGYAVPPVNIKFIRTGNSNDYAGIQLADLVAGAARCAIEARVSPKQASPGIAHSWFEAFKPTIEQESLFPALWPTDLRRHFLRRPDGQRGNRPRVGPWGGGQKRNAPCACGSGLKFKRCHGAPNRASQS